MVSKGDFFLSDMLMNFSIKNKHKNLVRL
jgi:hypothetical protein